MQAKLYRFFFCDRTPNPLILFLCAFCVSLGLGWHTLPSMAQGTVTQATVTEIIGNQVLINNRQARTRDIARSGQQVRTTQARTQLQFNTGAIARLGQNTSLTVGRECVQIQRGQMIVNGAANGCTRTVSAGVRGTTYSLIVDEQGQAHYQVLEGEIELLSRIDPNAKPVRLAQGQGILISPEGNFGSVRQMTADSYQRVLNREIFEGFTIQFPSLPRIQSTFEELFPGTPFPNPTTVPQLGWNTRLNFARVSNVQTRDALQVQLEIADKPLTTYANVVYQIYARKDKQWMLVYTNQGARLIQNQAGAVTLPPEIIPTNRLLLGRLGDRITLGDLELQAVTSIRYDLPDGRRDQRFETQSTQYYLNLPSVR